MKLTTLPSPEKLADYCKAKGIARLELFGSAVGDDFDPEESDIDLLVDYEPGRHPGLDHFHIAEELTELFGRKVDLNTAAWSISRLKHAILATQRQAAVRLGSPTFYLPPEMENGKRGSKRFDISPDSLRVAEDFDG